MAALENQGGIAGNIAARLVGTAWALVTFLAVPVIAIEGTGPFVTLKRSASIFKGKWGQQITGNLAIGAAIFLLGFLPAAILIAGGVLIWSSVSFLGALLVVIGAIVLAIAMLVSKALNGVFGVALYRYATEGEAVGGFTVEGQLESAVKVKGGDRNSPPTATPGTICQLAQPGLTTPRCGQSPMRAKRRGSLEQRPATPASTSLRIFPRSSTVQAISSTPASRQIRARRRLTSGW